MLMVSGMVRMQRYPLAAQAKAMPMPVLPDVGSTTTESDVRMPRFSASSSMATAMRSLTEEAGLKNSSLARTVAWAPSVMRFSLTSGVKPTRSVMRS